METKEILEGNKLIVEFLNCESHYYKGHYLGIDGLAYLPEDMRWSYSWDWLFFVLEKIEQTNKASIEIHLKNIVTIGYNKQTLKYFSGSLIENAFEAVIDFIKWHNQTSLQK